MTRVGADRRTVEGGGGGASGRKLFVVVDRDAWLDLIVVDKLEQGRHGR